MKRPNLDILQYSQLSSTLKPPYHRLLQPTRLLEMMRLFALFDKKVGKIIDRYQ